MRRIQRQSLYLTDIMVLFGASLVAYQFQVQALVNQQQIAPEATGLFGQFLCIVGCAIAARIALRPLRNRLTQAGWQYLSLLLAALLSSAGMAVFLPAIPTSQIALFGLFSAMLGFFVILFRAWLIRGRVQPDLIGGSIQLWDKRALIILWTRNNVRTRYSQAVLGIVWVVLLPLAQAIIMAFVFSQLVRMPVGDVPFVSFYLAALVPWAFINNGVVQGAVSLLNQMPLINQVYFPREILPLVKLGELAVDALFTFTSLVVINAVLGIFPSVNWIYLPVLAFITGLGTFGVMLFLSVFTIYVRDVPQLAFVAMQLLFYLSPIIYPVTFIPEQLRWFVMLNPLVPLIQGFREVLVFGVPVDMTSLYYPFVFAVAVFYVGYSFFKAHERRLTDYV